MSINGKDKERVEYHDTAIYAARGGEDNRGARAYMTSASALKGVTQNLTKGREIAGYWYYQG